ncbi:MAG TPA: hypothetical protein VD772_03630 [Anseongella sp.]|nr:hypothetical protein [Anseongella sp.]
MEELVINEGWERIKPKILRRFNHIREDQLTFSPGQEAQLVDTLQSLTRLGKAELVFMIRKMQVNLNNNRL